MSIIKTEHLTHIYSQGTPYERAALQDFNIEIEEGEFAGIIGHTGSGKSTFIQHLNGLLAPTEGKVYIDGEDLWADKKDLRRFRFKVGLVFQYPEYQLFGETVAADVAFGPTNMGLPPEEVEKRVRESLRFVGLSEDMMEKSPFELSGGQKRRVAIAGVLAMDPKVLILDEPTAGLDPRGRDTILGEIREYHEERKNTVLLVSHSMEDIAQYAKKVLVIAEGKPAMYDTVENIFSRVEELTAMGLAVPQISRVFAGLRAAGYQVPGNIYTVEGAAAAILNAVKGGAARCIRDITIGQYFPGKSAIHKMDPRIKILLSILYIVMLFVADNMWGLLLGVLFGFAAYLISRIPLSMIWKSMKPVVPIVIFTAVLNLFLSDWRPAVAVEVPQDHQGGHRDGGIHVGQNSVPHRGHLAADLYHLAHRPHRRHRAAAVASQEDQAAGARAGHDDDHRAAVYPHPHRGDGQDHVRPEGKGRRPGKRRRDAAGQGAAAHSHSAVRFGVPPGG